MYANARNVVTILHGPFIASGIGVMPYASIAPDRIHSAPHGAQARVQAISLWWATRSLNAYRKRPEVLAETSPHRLIREIRIIVSGVLPSAPVVSLHGRLRCGASQSLHAAGRVLLRHRVARGRCPGGGVGAAAHHEERFEP